MRREAGGLGRLGIQERFGLLGGRVDMEPRPGRGARLVAHMPIKGE